METISAQFADNLDTNALAERMDSGQLEARVEGRNSSEATCLQTLSNLLFCLQVFTLWCARV